MIKKLKENKYIVFILLAIGFGVVVFFQGEKIEQKDLTIREMAQKIEEYKKENSQLKITLENSKESKDIEIVEEVNPDGSKKTTKKIKTNKETGKATTDIVQNKEEKKTEEKSNKELIDKSLTITNRKKLSIGLGVDNQSNLNSFINGRDILNPAFEIEIRYRTNNNLELKLEGGKRFNLDDTYMGVGAKFFFDF